MQSILASLRATSRLPLQGPVAAAATCRDVFTTGAPQLGFLASSRTIITSRTSSEIPKSGSDTPKPDTPDSVAPEIQNGAAPMDNNNNNTSGQEVQGNKFDLNERDGGEGGPGKIPLKNEHVKEEEIPLRKKEIKEETKEEGKDEDDGSMGPGSVGDTHRLDYSR